MLRNQLSKCFYKPQSKTKNWVRICINSQKLDDFPSVLRARKRSEAHNRESPCRCNTILEMFPINFQVILTLLKLYLVSRELFEILLHGISNASCQHSMKINIKFVGNLTDRLYLYIYIFHYFFQIQVAELHLNNFFKCLGFTN